MPRRAAAAPPLHRRWSRQPEEENPQPTVREGIRELVLLLGVTLAYFLTRGLIRGRRSDAFYHADQVISLERRLHLDPEHTLQNLALQHHTLLEAANTFYLVGHLPVLIAVAVWLYWRHHRSYHLFRNAFLLSALIGLSIYVFFPVAPPRFLPGFTDTEATTGFNVDGSAAGPFYNPYAALPSLHVGWTLIPCFALLLFARFWPLRIFGALLPLLMTLSVIMTGNHYFLDPVAGVAVMLVA
ncbi:MAG TPA: phosphatase PAP2 family protein, partial [Chloroflexota bacterium]